MRFPEWEYNDCHAAHLRNAAGGSFRLFADQPGGVRIGCGVETSGVLQAWRKASLRDDGEPIGIVVRSRRAGWQMRFLSGRSGDSRESNCKFAWSFPGDLCRAQQSSGFATADGSALPNILWPRRSETRTSYPPLIKRPSNPVQPLPDGHALRERT
jgi:hypothetical protein